MTDDRWDQRGHENLCVPGRIVVAFVAEFGLYGFRRDNRPFTEFSRILEKSCATIDRHRGERCSDTMVFLWAWGLVLCQPAFEKIDGGGEVVVEFE